MPDFDTSVPHPARSYNYWLGGKDNFAADRESGDAIAAATPTVRTAVRENRRVPRAARSGTWPARRASASSSTSAPASRPRTTPTRSPRRVAPDARVVYVDNDPIVLTHARALLTSTPRAATAYIDADLRDTATILGPELRRHSWT